MKKWNIGSNKLVKCGSEEWERLEELSAELNSRLAQQDIPEWAEACFTVEECWEDFGSNMMWTTIVCYYYDHIADKGSSFQVLDPAQWIGLANGDITVKELADSIQAVCRKYCKFN